MIEVLVARRLLRGPAQRTAAADFLFSFHFSFPPLSSLWILIFVLIVLYSHSPALLAVSLH